MLFAMTTDHIIVSISISISITKSAAVSSEETVNDEQKRWRQKTGLHTNMFGPEAELSGPAKAWKKSGGLVKTSSSSSSRSARVFNRSGGRRGELLLSW